MSAPNGQRGAKTPSNISTPAPSAGTLHSGMGPSVSQGMASGQSNTGASAFQTTHSASMNTGRGQTAGISNAAAQIWAQTPPGSGRGRARGRGGRDHSFASAGTMQHATIQAPGAGGRGEGTPSVLGKRGSESMEDVSEETTANRPLKPRGLPDRQEQSSQANTLSEVTNVEPLDKSEETTSIMIQRNTSGGVEIDLKLDPDTEDGREMLLDAARRVRRKNGNVDILVSMRPALDRETLEGQALEGKALEGQALQKQALWGESSDEGAEEIWAAQRQAAFQAQREARKERTADPVVTNSPVRLPHLSDRSEFTPPGRPNFPTLIEYLAAIEKIREESRLDP